MGLCDERFLVFYYEYSTIHVQSIQIYDPPKLERVRSTVPTPVIVNIISRSNTIYQHNAMQNQIKTKSKPLRTNPTSSDPL